MKSQGSSPQIYGGNLDGIMMVMLHSSNLKIVKFQTQRMKNLHHSNTAPDAPNNTQKGGPLTPSGCGEFTPGGSFWYSEARYSRSRAPMLLKIGTNVFICLWGLRGCVGGSRVASRPSFPRRTNRAVAT